MQKTCSKCGSNQEQVLLLETESRRNQRRNLSTGDFFKLSKSDSLDSNYSRMTSLFGLGSRQSSTETHTDPGQRMSDFRQDSLGRRKQSTAESAGSKGSEEQDLPATAVAVRSQGNTYLFLKRADAIEEVSPSLERSPLPNIVVHRAEDSEGLETVN